MKLRDYRPEDCKETTELLYNTVHTVNLKDYTEKQVEAWAPQQGRDLVEWNKRLLKDHTVVVEKDNIIVGFGNIDDTGYFDLLYVHKDYQGQGVATLIADDLEKYRRLNGIRIFTTAASITAKPFFEKRGYVVENAQTIESRGQKLINYKMKKIITV